MRLRNLLRSPEFWVILAPFIIFAPVLFGQAMFWGVPVLQFHPWHVYAWETLKSGHLPLWNPLSGIGSPLIANYQSALFYPPNWLYFLLALLGGNAAMAWGMGFLSTLHLAFAGLGMVRLTKALGLGTVAQTVSGLAFGLSGYLVARTHFLSINIAVPWIPWILLAAYEMVSGIKVAASSDETPRVPGQKGNSWELFGTSGSSFLKLTFFLAMLLLAGHAQTAWYTLLLTGVWLCFWIWQFDRRLSVFIRVLTLFGLAGLAATALSAVQLIPTAELLSQSQRAGGADYDFVMTYSFWPWRLIGLLAPGFFGSPVTGDFWGYATFWEDAIYIGLLPFMLALRTIPLAFKKNNQSPITNYQLPIPSLTRFLWLTIIVTFLLAFGQNTPIFPFLYRYVPTFDLFQAPTRYTIWAVTALALLAGIGAEHWYAPVGKRARGKAFRGVAIALAILLAAFAAGWVVSGVEPSFIRATEIAGALGVVAGLLSLSAPKPKANAYSQIEFEGGPEKNISRQTLTRTPTSNFPALVGAFVALDLIIAGWGLNPGSSIEFYKDTLDQNLELRAINSQLRGGRLYLPADNEYALTYDRYMRFDTFHADFTGFRESFIPNLNLLDQIPSVNNFDPLRPDRYVRWMDALDAAPLDQQAQMLAMMGVTVIEHYLPDANPAPNFEPFLGQPRFQWFPCAWPAYDGENAWELLFENPPELDRPFVTLEGYETNVQWACGQADEADIRLVDESANEIRLQVEAESSGWLLIADTWYPGWTAEVNGQNTPIYRANYLFRAVDIPAGGGEVVMQYRPMGFWIGVVLSGLAWVGLGVVWTRYRK